MAMAIGKWQMGNPEQACASAFRRGLGCAVLAALLASTAVTAVAEEILRPRDKAAFEAELKALQDKYGAAPAPADDAETAIVVAEPTAQPVPAAPVPANTDAADTESAAIVVDASGAEHVTETAAVEPEASAPPPAAPLFPGTLLQPRRISDTVAEAAPAPDNVDQAPADSLTPSQPDGAKGVDSTRAISAPTASAPADAPPTLQFSGTVLTPRGAEAASAQAASEPAATVSPQAAMPTRRLSPPAEPIRSADELDGAPALRIALLPVGQKQFLLREQVYDAESLEIYLRKLEQPIDSVVLLDEADHPIELGHLVALGQLSRTLRVPTLYQQGNNLRALSVR